MNNDFGEIMVTCAKYILVALMFYTVEAALSVHDQRPLGETCPPADKQPCGQKSCTNSMCHGTELDGKLCCQDSCGKMTCVDPTFPVKSGKCPVTNDASNTECRTKWSCSRDEQCQGSKKCCAVSKVCKMCVDPLL